jgi:hypothetical protein
LVYFNDGCNAQGRRKEALLRISYMLDSDCMLNMTAKVKAVLLQNWSCPEGSRKLRFPDFMTKAQDGGKVVSLTHRPPLLHRKYTWYSFLLEFESTPGP